MLEDSIDGDTNDNDEGLNHKVPLLVAPKPPMRIVDSTLDALLFPLLDVAPASSIDTSPLSTLEMDKFYNATKKAPHLEAIILKDLGWWMNR